MTEISDLIFSRNSTLFEVLDELDIPSLAISVNDLKDRLNSQVEQLRQLGIVVDNNQINNNTRFLTLQTELEDVTKNLVNLISNNTTLITSMGETVHLNTVGIYEMQIRLLTIEGDITTLKNRINIVEGGVKTLSQTTDRLSVEVGTLTNKVNTLSTTVSTLSTTVNSLNTRFPSVESNANSAYNSIHSIPLNMAELYYSSAYLVRGAIYQVVNQSSTNYYQRQLIINKPEAPSSLRMGQVLQGTFGGVSYTYIMFSDNVTSSTGASFQIQNGFIPVGGPITMRYGTDQSYTIAQVRITKQYFRQ